MAKREAIKLIKKFLLVLKQEGIIINKAYLYGSYSTNTANKDSDIDVLLVSESINENDDASIGKIWRLTKKVSTKLEPIIVSTNHFNRTDASPLIEKIKTYGVEIN